MRPGALRAATAKAAARLGKTRTRLTAGEKPNRKRMAALVTVYDAEPARRPHDVIAPPGGRNGSRPLRPGAARMRPAGRNDSSRYVLSSLDKSSKRNTKQIIGLIVRSDRFRRYLT
jgi:hypothetical protein